MAILWRGVISLLLLMLMAIPAFSEGIAFGIESRFHYLLLFG